MQFPRHSILRRLTGRSHELHLRAARVHWFRRDYPKCMDEAKQAAGLAEAFLSTPDSSRRQTRTAKWALQEALFFMGRVNIFRSNWVEAEVQLRRVMDLEEIGIRGFDGIGLDKASMIQTAPQWLAVALARQGRLTEADEVTGRRRMNAMQTAYAKGDHSLYVRWELASGHYASALTQPDDAAGREKRRAALRQAGALLDESSEEARQLSQEIELRRLIDEELAALERK